MNMAVLNDIRAHYRRYYYFSRFALKHEISPSSFFHLIVCWKIRIHSHYWTSGLCSPETKPYPSESNPLLAELTTYLENAGLSDPFSKIYITTEGLIENFALFCFLLIIQQVQKYQYNERLGTFEGNVFIFFYEKLISTHLRHGYCLFRTKAKGSYLIFVFIFLKVFWSLET
jgi:hypothetical protein